MSNEKNPNTIGDPEPIEFGKGFNILTGIASFILIPVGAFLAIGSVLRPVRVQGATRSAQLLWQRRQAEIQQVLPSSTVATTKDPAQAAKLTEEPNQIAQLPAK